MDELWCNCLRHGPCAHGRVRRAVKACRRAVGWHKARRTMLLLPAAGAAAWPCQRRAIIATAKKGATKAPKGKGFGAAPAPAAAPKRRTLQLLDDLPAVPLDDGSESNLV